jgi:hypothetical protein
MSKSIRIRTTPLGEDKFIKVKIDQDFDFLEILSLKITQDEAYQRYCSDYGVIVGRVVVNNGFGVPNAKVSVFIPIDEEDKQDPLKVSLYPYESVYTKDKDGVRYNLLTKNFKDKDPCYVPVGTIPSKREVLDCDVKLEVFEKYYKFSTTTNSAGDYMIFGVPVGEQTIHVDVDLSDIGSVSQKPYELIAQGYSKKQFVSNTQFKKTSSLDSLSQIKSRNTSTTVIPFWGDPDNCEIGISRVDFDLNYNIIPTSIMMGSTISDTFKSGVNKNCRPRPEMGLMKQMSTSSGTIDIIRKMSDGSTELFVPQGESSDINENGVYSFQIPMNLDPVITDEFGNQIPSADPSIGIPTKAKIRMRVGLGDSSSLNKKYMRAKHLVPNRTNDYSFGPETPDSEFAELKWKKIYTTKQFIVRYQKGSAANKRSRTSIKQVDNNLGPGINPFPYNRIDPEINPLFSILCLIIAIMLLIVTAINGITIPALNFLVALLNVNLSIICVIMYYIIGSVLGSIIKVLNGIIDAINALPGIDLPNIGGNSYCAYCINTNPGKCAEGFPGVGGGKCACDEPILPYIPCIVIKCAEERFAPGCSPLLNKGQAKCDVNVFEGVGYFAGQGWCSANKSEKIDHWGPIYASTAPVISCGHNFTSTTCNNGANNGHSLDNFYGFYDCFQSQMAKSMNLYQLDFYNDYINGVLYFYTFKFKYKSKKKNSLEVYCDYDCHGKFDNDINDPINKRNDCSNRSKLLETCVSQGTGSLANNEVYVDLFEGLVKDYLGEKYYPAYDHQNKYIMFASDLICLGSTEDCSYDNSRKIINQLETTTYQIPILTSETDEETGEVEETGADPLLYNIRCTAPQCYVTARNCANIRKICELGVGVDETTEDYIFDNNGNLVSTIVSGPNCTIDICNGNLDGADIQNNFVRTELAYANGVDRNVNTCTQLYTDYTGYLPAYLGNDTTNEYFGDLRLLKNRSKNSYYFYFGLYNGKTALDNVLNTYFTKCNDLNPTNKIAVKINTDNNICVNGNDGQMTIKILSGTSPWTYNVNGPTQIPNGTTSGNLLTLSNLLSGTYVLTITDSNGISNVYSATINEPNPITIIPSIKSTTSPTSNNGSISLTILGGNPPYNYNWSPTPPFNQNGSIISGLTSNSYNVTVSDSAIGSCTSQFTTLTGLTVTSPSVLGFTISTSKDISGNYNINCKNGSDGQIIINNVTGGTAPYSVYVNGQIHTNGFTITNLSAGTYNITVYDSTSGQSTTKVTQLIDPPVLSAVINGNTSLSCYGCKTDLEIIPNGGVAPYTYSWNTSNSDTTKTVSVGAGDFKWSVRDSNGCLFNGTTNVTQPIRLKINNVITTNPICYNGSGTVNFDVQGGVGPYTYKIYKASSGISYVDNAMPCAGPAAVNSTINGNSASCLSGIGSTTPIGSGNIIFGSANFSTNVKNTEQFYIEVKDTNNCTTCTTFSLTSPTQLNLALTKLSGIGAGNFNILAIANGGTTSTGDYNFTLHSGSCGGTVLTTITTGGGSVIFNNPPGGSGYTSGTYYVNVEDSNNCTNCKTIIL